MSGVPVGRKLRSYMVLHGDTLSDLAAALGIAVGTVCRKVNGGNGRDFRQSEIRVIMNRYRLTPDEVCAIFFAD